MFLTILHPSDFRVYMVGNPNGPGMPPNVESPKWSSFYDLNICNLIHIRKCFLTIYLDSSCIAMLGFFYVFSFSLYLNLIFCYFSNRILKDSKGYIKLYFTIITHSTVGYGDYYLKDVFQLFRSENLR